MVFPIWPHFYWWPQPSIVLRHCNRWKCIQLQIRYRFCVPFCRLPFFSSSRPQGFFFRCNEQFCKYIDWFGLIIILLLFFSPCRFSIRMRSKKISSYSVRDMIEAWLHVTRITPTQSYSTSYYMYCAVHRVHAITAHTKGIIFNRICHRATAQFLVMEYLIMSHQILIWLVCLRWNLSTMWLWLD